MRPAHRPGTRRWLLLPAAAALVLSGLAAGCSSSKPAYCTAADQLKTSVQDLGNVNVAQNGLSSLQTALTSVKTNTTTLANEAQSTFAPQITALQTSLAGLQTAINSAKSQPSVAAAAAVVPSVTQVKTSASALQSAVSGKCQ
jgi:hypothetical protein